MGFTWPCYTDGPNCSQQQILRSWLMPDLVSVFASHLTWGRVFCYLLLCTTGKGEQQLLGLVLSLPPFLPQEPWSYSAPLCLALCVFWRYELGSLCLFSKSFTYWPISAPVKVLNHVSNPQDLESWSWMIVSLRPAFATRWDLLTTEQNRTQQNKTALCFMHSWWDQSLNPSSILISYVNLG